MKTAFTLIELLVVIVILGLLITLGSKGLRAARISAKKTQAKVEMKSIETAVMAYINKYGKLPVPDSDQGATDFSDADAVISVLTGNDPSLNPANVVFLEPQGNGTAGFLDPWGRPYAIKLDSDYDGLVDLEGSSAQQKVGVAALGLSEKSGSTNDVVFSWD